VIVAAIVKAILALIAEVMRETLGKTKTATDADKVPQTIRARWDRHLREQLRDKP